MERLNAKRRTAKRCAAIVFLAIFASFATTSNAQVVDSFTEPIAQSDVAAAESGVIDSISITEGQAVKRGDTLAMLDHDALRQSLRIAELRAQSTSEITSAEATLRIRKTRRDTLEPLLAKGHANPAEVEEAIVEHEIATSDLETAREKQAEYKLEVARINAQIKARTIASPIDGVVSELHYRLGEYVSSSKPQFATVVQLDQLLVRFYLLEDTVVGLHQGQQVSLMLRIGGRQQQIVGTIRFVSPVTDPDSGTARIDVVIDNANGAYRSGSKCRWVGPPEQISANNLQRTVETGSPSRSLRLDFSQRARRVERTLLITQPRSREGTAMVEQKTSVAKVAHR